MRTAILSGAILGTLVLANGAAAQSEPLYFSPELAAEFTAPSAFDGLYAGALLGPISARKNNFNSTGAEIRPEMGAVIGWNQPIAPGVILGGELQATVAADFAGSSYLRLMALARLGFAAGDNTLAYVFGGAGRLGEGGAFEVGMGTEVMVTDAMALRLEAAGIGQLGPVPNGNDIPAFSAMRITSGAIWQLDGGPGATGFNSGPVTRFTGPYAGLHIGGLTDPQFKFYDDYGWGWHLSRFEMGGFAGYNHAVTDIFRAGVELQLGLNYDTSGDAGVDALALARVGVVPLEGLQAYAAGGLGLVEGHGAYALGGGVEYALWGQTSLRAEGLIIDRLDGTPGQSKRTTAPSSKVTIGMVWHFD